MKLSETPLEAPINILCHHGNVNIINDRPDVVSIDPMDTMNRAKQIGPESWRCLKKTPQFITMFRTIFPDIDLPDHPLQMHGYGVQHVVGLLVLTCEVILAGKTPFWRTPEAYLHPSAQLGLADVLISFTRSHK